MIKTIKMTGISADEVRNILLYIDKENLLCPEIIESKFDVVLKCDINYTNKTLYSQLFSKFSEFIYTDEDETPYERFKLLCEIRKLKICVIEQGFRGKLTSNLLSVGCNINFSAYFGKESDLIKFLNCSDIKEGLLNFCNDMSADVVIASTAEFDGEGVISSKCKIFVCTPMEVFTFEDYKFGECDDIANSMSFLATAFAIRKIY